MSTSGEEESADLELDRSRIEMFGEWMVRRSVRLQFKFPAVPAVNKKKLTLCGLVASRNKLSGLFQNRIDYEVTFS